MANVTDSERLARMEKWRQEVIRYRDFFEDAFDEFHEAVVRTVKTPGTYVGPHHDYPTMSVMESGFPHFSEQGFYKDSTPRDYVSTLRPTTLAGLLGGPVRPRESFPKGGELTEFLRSSQFSARLGLMEDSASWVVDGMVAHAVERYLHLYGLDAPIDSRKRSSIIWPMISATISKQLHMRMIVPIALTHFDVDRFKLTENTYIVRLSRKMQLARFRIHSFVSGAPKMVVGAATHAFVSTDWHIEADDVFSTRNSLSRISGNVLEAIDRFFGALRVVTGLSTGYAQVVWMPKSWVLDYFCDLPVLYGATIRNYPSDFDDYAWTFQRPNVARAQLLEIRRVFQNIADNRERAVAIAVKRLNSCLTRSDAADGLLDAVIGLEVLLGDDQNQSLSYKLRLRAGALAMLAATPQRSPTDVAAMVKKVYAARSTIVHGLRKKDSKMAAEAADTRYEEDRVIAADLLRFVLDVLLTHPSYISPDKIDADLLLRGVISPAIKAGPSEKKAKATGRLGKAKIPRT